MTWRRLGDLVSTVVAKGLHGEIGVSHEVSFWLSEIRKRTFAVTYNFDKGISSFLGCHVPAHSSYASHSHTCHIGRPPRLPRRYCTMQLPLDLNEEHVRLPEAQLNDELNRLDEFGWNTNGEFRGTLYVRTSLICNMIREDILELELAALSVNDVEFTR